MLGLGYIPLAVFILFPLIFATTFTIAVNNGHIKAFYSFISDTGTTPKEQCIFSLGLSVAMLFVGATAYIRYKMVDDFIQTKSKERAGHLLNRGLNISGFFFGLMAALGTVVVGSFQETNWLAMHIVGAFLTFGGGSIFLIIQGILTKRMAPHFGSNILASFRILLGVSCMILFVAMMVLMAISAKQFDGDNPLLWERTEGGYVAHVASVVSEWVMAALFDLYFLTFVPEFKRLKYVAPQVKLNKFYV